MIIVDVVTLSWESVWVVTVRLNPEPILTHASLCQSESQSAGAAFLSVFGFCLAPACAVHCPVCGLGDYFGKIPPSPVSRLIQILMFPPNQPRNASRPMHIQQSKPQANALLLTTRSYSQHYYVYVDKSLHAKMFRFPMIIALKSAK